MFDPLTQQSESMLDGQYWVDDCDVSCFLRPAVHLDLIVLFSVPLFIFSQLPTSHEP